MDFTQGIILLEIFRLSDIITDIISFLVNSIDSLIRKMQTLFNLNTMVCTFGFMSGRNFSLFLVGGGHLLKSLRLAGRQTG